MDMAKQRLLYALPGETVSQIAMQCGFTHLGRFSLEYKKRFGASPGETINHIASRGNQDQVPVFSTG